MIYCIRKVCGKIETLENIRHNYYVTCRQILTDPFTGRIKGQQEKIYRTTLGKTLEVIAEKGPDALYNGQLTENFVRDIQKEGGIITAEDLSNYRCR